jgi:hypothetical protein
MYLNRRLLWSDAITNGRKCTQSEVLICIVLFGLCGRVIFFNWQLTAVVDCSALNMTVFRVGFFFLVKFCCQS